MPLSSSGKTPCTKQTTVDGVSKSGQLPKHQARISKNYHKILPGPQESSWETVMILAPQIDLEDLESKSLLIQNAQFLTECNSR